jgi:hypothetical protein
VASDVTVGFDGGLFTSVFSVSLGVRTYSGIVPDRLGNTSYTGGRVQWGWVGHGRVWYYGARGGVGGGGGGGAGGWPGGGVRCVGSSVQFSTF